MQRNLFRYMTVGALMASLGLLAGPAQAGEEEMAELEVEVPDPMFEGTPKDLPDDLKLQEDQLETERGPIRVPSGATENVALDKPVEASEDWPIIGSAELVTDGNKSSTPGSYLELGPGEQWVQIDLEQPHEIFAIIVWHYHQEGRVYRDVLVQVSNDENMEENVKTVFNNDHDNSLGYGTGDDWEYIETNEGQVVRVEDGVVGQYVRCLSNGNTSNAQNHYIEVAVYGRPVDQAAEGEADKQQASSN